MQHNVSCVTFLTYELYNGKFFSDFNNFAQKVTKLNNTLIKSSRHSIFSNINKIINN